MAIPYNTNYDLTMPFSDICAQINLNANTEELLIIPGNNDQKYSARFSYSSASNVFVSLNAAPIIPAAGTVGTQQYNEFRPGGDGSQRYVTAGDVLHFITPDVSAYVGIRLMAVA